MDFIWGHKVASSDGWAGRLAGVLVASEPRHATHLIVKRGLLPPTRLAVPIGSLDHCDDESIYLSLPILELLKFPKWSGSSLQSGFTALNPNTRIHLADGGSLRLRGLRVASESHLSTHLIARRPGRGNLLLPIQASDEVSASSVRLGVDAAALLELPLHRLDLNIESDLMDALGEAEQIPEVDLNEVRISVAEGVITLEGNTRTPSVNGEVERIARAVEGCVAVENRLASDWEINLAVATYISRHAPRLSNSVVVNAQFGTINLEGTVQAVEDRDTLLQGAKSIDGVRGINDLTEVHSPAPAAADPPTPAEGDAAESKEE